MARLFFITQKKDKLTRLTCEKIEESQTLLGNIQILRSPAFGSFCVQNQRPENHQHLLKENQS